MRTKNLALVAIAAITALVAACSSGPTKTSGTETWTGKQVLTKAQLSQQNFQPTYPLSFTGPVHATANFTPPGGNADKVQVTFHTTAGNLVANADLPGNSNQNAPPTSFSAKTCVATFDQNGTYVVVGSKSTGSFKNATGHGKIRDAFTVTLPKTASGACNESNSAQPVAGYTTLVVSGPMTVTSG